MKFHISRTQGNGVTEGFTSSEAVIEHLPQIEKTLSVARPFTLFLTGLPASGKTTLARAMESELGSRGIDVRVWDGDEVRATVSQDLGFSREDRIENVRRMATLAATSEQSVSVVAAVSPSDEARTAAKDVIQPIRDFVLVYVATPATVCESRDPKGLYARARSGEIENFTGVSDPYEAPKDAHLVIDTSVTALEDSVALVVDLLINESLLK